MKEGNDVITVGNGEFRYYLLWKQMRYYRDCAAWALLGVTCMAVVFFVLWQIALVSP